MKTADQDDSGQWRGKYLQALRELDAEEQRWSELDQVLRRALGRLALAAMGAHPELDRRLKTLRDAARREDCEGERLETLAREAAEFASQRQHTADAAEPGHRVLAALLDHPALPPRLRAGAAPLRTRIEGAGDEDVSSLLDEVVELLRGSFAQPPRADTAEASPPGLRETLFRFIERLEFPEHFQRRVERLKEQLEPAGDLSDVSALLEALADLVGEALREVREEKREIEAFLKQVTDRLRELDTSLRDADLTRRASLSSGRELQHSVSAEVDQIRSSVVDASDLSQLKLTVRQRLDAVQQHMQSFLEAEDRHNREAEERMMRLSARVQEMEAETRTLEEHLRAKHDEAMRDGLTGLFNRPAYDQRVRQEYERWKRYASPLSIVLVDVDDFKNINDRYGHLAGDKALRTLAAQIRARVRNTDFVARYGGEEFVVLMPNTSVEDALRVAEKLRTGVEACPFHHRGKPVAVSISCGVARFREGDDPESVFQRADEALYRAKHEGRNRSRLETVEAEASAVG